LQRISTEALETLQEIADWYLEKNYTYIRVYGCNTPPHLLPRYVSDKLLTREVTYQTMEVGIVAALQTANKRSWPNFPIKLGKFTLTNIPHARKEVLALKEMILCIETVKKHDPKNVMYNHTRP
jgi:hypothetical protein